MVELPDGASGMLMDGGDGFAGDGRPATSPGVAMNLPEGVAADAPGNLLIADTRNNRIREVTG
jgi:hypothetical protein